MTCVTHRRAGASHGWLPTRTLPVVILATLLSLTIAHPAAAQFTPVSTTVPGLKNSAVEWGDFDNDGDLDLAVCGQDAGSNRVTAIYRNDGGTFVDVGASLPGIEQAALGWADMDADGDLDLLISGLSAGEVTITRLYLNSAGTFSDADAGLPGLSGASLDWADYDRDGRIDLVLLGTDSSGQPLTRIYRNTNSGYVNAAAGLLDLEQGDAAWGDFDDDGDPDLLVMGLDDTGVSHTVLYRNDAGTFVDSGISLTGAYDGSLAWADTDNDGDLDFALTGRAPAFVGRVYSSINGTTFSFTDLPAPGLARSSVSFGDYDSDGYPDLILTGVNDSNVEMTNLYRGGTGPFTLEATTLPAVKSGAANWGDFDNDRRLDVFITGQSPSGPVTGLYQRTGGNANNPPGTPPSPTTSISGNVVTLSWGMSGDSETSSNALSYNLRIGNSPGGDQFTAAMADSVTGFRRIVRRGNAGRQLSWQVPLSALPPQSYWSVQSIDAAHAGSPFTAAQAISYASSSTALTSTPNPSQFGQPVTLTATVTPASAIGTVTFLDGAASLGTGTLSGGEASLATSALTVGTHSLTALYAGGGTTLGSTSSPLTHAVQPSPEPTTTTLTSSPNPSAPLELVTFTATVTPATASGQVELWEGTTFLGASQVSGGSAIFQHNSLASGAHVLTANYLGDSSTLPSTSPPHTHIVLLATSTALDINPSPSLIGQSVTLTATVTPATATGIVTFRDDGNPIGTGTLSGGVATFTTTSLALDNHALTATYPGDADHAGSASAIVGHFVQLPTTLALTADPSPSQQGDLVTLTATLTPVPPYGAISFFDGANFIGSATMTDGVATNVRVFNTLGFHLLTAAYTGDPSHAAAISALVNHQVRGITTTTLMSSPNPSTLGQSVTLTATVGPAAATGSVTFLDGGSPIGSGVLGGGQATLAVNTLAIGLHTLTATYAGDSTYVSSGSGTVGHRVEAFEDLGAGLVGVVFSAVAWGDYDADGDLDLVVAGDIANGPVTQLYRNGGGPNPSFTPVSSAFQGVVNASLAWGDYDNDGDLDLLLSGAWGNRYTRLYRNSGGVNPTFLESSVVLPGVNTGSLAWGDCDADGDLDIVLSGDSDDGRIFRVYLNSGGPDPTFIDSLAGLPGLDFSSVAWGDYDNDGDLDLLASGMTGFNGLEATRISRVYRNVGGSPPGFEDIGAGLVPVSSGSAAWGDYDNDGDLDILLTGNVGDNTSSTISRLYRNNGGPSPTFADAGGELPGVFASSVAWGDYDNDGYLDFLLSGGSGLVGSSRLYRNTGGSTPAFAEVPVGLPGIHHCSVAWGDCDNDGDLDIVLAGELTGGAPITRLYRNSGVPSNTPPTPPTGLTSTPSGNHITLSWNPVTDTQTPTAGLSYNLRVGTTPGGSEIVSPMSGADGYRRVGGHGNAQKRTSWTITLPSPSPGHIYWSVQAIDGAWAGSPFAPEQVASTASFTDIAAGLPGTTQHTAVWGDYDNDGDLDLLLTGASIAGTIARIYRNSGGTNPTFVNIGAGLLGAADGSAAWGDYDNDGYLDVLIAGAFGTTINARLYHNSGGANPSFSVYMVPLPGVGDDGSVAWGDFDNDGDLDLLMSGFDNSQPISRIYRNSGGALPTFTDINANLIGLREGTGTWTDYDGDGDLDVLLTGADVVGITTTRLYRNNGAALPPFLPVSTTLPPIDEEGTAAWGDYDNDGDLDLLLTGNGTGNTPLCRIYRNSGGPSPTFSLSGGLTGIADGTAVWGDFDNDGNLDIAASGANVSGTRITRIYRSSGGPNPTFADIGAGLPGAFEASLAWGDFDNDGDLDLVLTGDAGGATGLISRIYRNDGVPTNSIPAAPTNLLATRSGNQLTLSWTAATDAQTPGPGLSYNLRVGTTPGGGQIMPAMADGLSGYRRLVALGNAQKRTSWTLTVPSSANVFWSVQAIDGAFAGSPWAADAVSAVEPRVELPAVTALGMIAPNPFRVTARVAFDLHEEGRASLRIFDVRGRLIRTLNEGPLPPGHHETLWDGTDDAGQRQSAGVYLVRLEAMAFRETRRVVLLP